LIVSVEIIVVEAPVSNKKSPDFSPIVAVKVKAVPPPKNFKGIVAFPVTFGRGKFRPSSCTMAPINMY